MKFKLLRTLLLVDFAVLLLLGILFLFAPRQVEAAFGFKDLPAGVSYIIALYGCVMATMSIGYFFAAVDPLRNVVWIQVGIARGVLEVLAGIIYAARGTVTWSQAEFGIAVAGFITVAYLALYPREAEARRTA
jgi:hypothetical protein